MIKKIISITFLFFWVGTLNCYAQQKTNVILIGTVHFNNPGFDRSKVADINILDATRQRELEELTAAIAKKYRPDKVFVESCFATSNQLNQQYILFRSGQPFFNEDTLSAFHKKFYTQNEIFQLGFRLAKKSKNDSIYSMDYLLEQRYDLLEAEFGKSSNLSADSYTAALKQLGSQVNDCLSGSLTSILKCLNAPELMRRNKGMYISYINRLSNEPDFFGPDFVSGWFKRNLIMYANVQNQVSENDKNIVIIAGVGHAAMFYDFIKNDPGFNLIDFNEVIR